jgi:hypothetical protein
VFADLVALEQAQLEVQDEVDDAKPVETSALAALTPAQWETARFAFVRALRVVSVSHDVLPVIEAVARGQTPARPQSNASCYLVHRTSGRLRTRRISAREGTLLESFVSGQGFAEVCEAARLREGAVLAEIALDAVRLLVDASQRGLLLRVEPADRSS